MSQEEKAKAYDDLLVKLQKAKVDNDVCDERYCCVIDSIVPELKESEGERIRKELIDFLEYYRLNNVLDSKTISLLTDSVAWLEKQGEKGTNGNEREIPNFAWNEEDEEMLNSFLQKLEVCDLLSNKESIWIKNKLKSLKDRVGCEVNCTTTNEWSAEDKRNLLDVKCIIDEIWHNQNVREEIDHSSEELESLWHWLDNIWKRVGYPQSQWKPSDEQIKALNRAMYHVEDDVATQIAKLIGDLKKLREK